MSSHPPSATPASLVFAPSDCRIVVSVDRETAVYRAGERAVFRVRVLREGIAIDGGEVAWTLSTDGMAPLQTGTAPLREGVAEISGQLGEPGFLRCEVVYRQGAETWTAAAGAAFDPLRIGPSLPAPEDFDLFWDGQKRRLASVPADVRLTPPPRTAEGLEIYDLHAACLGQPVSGYFALPAGAAPHSLPAIVTFHGAGVYDSDFDQAANWARAGFLALDINAHGLPNGEGKDFYAHHNETSLKDYRTRGRGCRETTYFLGMFLRVLRALDFMTSRPEWDGRTLVCYGGSQGGAQALAGGGLDPRVTFVVATVPAMSDHTGMAAGRIAGWPKWVPVDADGKPDPVVLETARYFDTVNLAARIRGGAFFSVGFCDAVCPPTGVFAAYNQIPGAKEIFCEVAAGHEVPQRVWDEARRRVVAHAAR